MSLVLDGEHALRTHAQSARSIATVPTPVTATLRRRDDAVRDALGGLSLRTLASSTSDAWRALPAGRERAA